MEQQHDGRPGDANITTDSLTLGQLKKIVAHQRNKQKELQYSFEYTETDTLLHELEDWYVYESEPWLGDIHRAYRAVVKTGTVFVRCLIFATDFSRLACDRQGSQGRYCRKCASCIERSCWSRIGRTLSDLSLHCTR